MKLIKQVTQALKQININRYQTYFFFCFEMLLRATLYILTIQGNSGITAAQVNNEYRLKE